MNPKTRFSLAAVFFTFFVDTLCWSIVFPIFAPYFLDTNNPMLASNISIATRTTILGFFLMAFSLGQFFGAPIIGEYADRHGRKKALLISIPATLFGLIITAWCMHINSLPGLFIGRLMTGVFASNGSICLASVSDLSENESIKTKNFGYFSVLAGFSFVVGAFVGGKLADPSINSYFSPSFPIWIAAAITILNFIFVLFAFSETMHIEKPKRFSFFFCFQNLKIALQTKKIHNIYTIYFLFIFSWTILLQFIPVVMIKRFAFTSSNIGDLALFVGICWAIGSGHLKQWLVEFFSSRTVLKTCFLIMPFIYAYVVFPEHIYNLLALLSLCVILGGMIWPLCTSTISNLAPTQMQGKILSMSQSIQSFAMTIAPVIGGVAFKFSFYLPFLIGAFASLIAGILYWCQDFKSIEKSTKI